MNNDEKLEPNRILEIFDHLAPILADRCGGMVHLVRVMGPRWSYVAGYVPDDLPEVPPTRVMLDEEWAVLYYAEPGRKVEPESVKELFLEALRKHDDA